MFMKKKFVCSILLIALSLTACGRIDNTTEPPEKNSLFAADNTSNILEVKENDSNGLAKSQEVTLSGQGGTISLQIPEGWKSISFPDCGDYVSYKIWFYPENIEKGYIELSYINSFGVCGTGLFEEEITLAGDTASMGTYDNHAYWDFIAFKGKNKGLVANAFSVEDWSKEYTIQAMEILNTASINTENLSKTENLHYDDTNIEDIGLSINIAKISPTGAELYFTQYDGNPKGNLEYSDDFIIEKFEEGEWIQAPIVVEGDYGFNDIAYSITNEDVTDFKIDWKWLYGELEPGEYRIGKGIIDFVETGSYDKYMIYVHFIIN
jgi:hypothetical protein